MNKLFFTSLILFSFSNIFAELIVKQIIIPDYLKSNQNFTSIAISNLDDIYLLETNNHEIIKIDFHGKILNSNGGFGWDNNSLNNPSNICINSSLNIIISDKNNHRIMRFDKNLNFISSLPNENSFIELMYPKVVEITKDGIFFILLENNYEILKLDAADESYQSIGTNVDKEFELIEPIDIVLTKNQDLIILESSGKILKFDKFGSPIKIINLQFDDFIPEKIRMASNKYYLLSDKGNIYKKNQNNWEMIFESSQFIISDFFITNNLFYLLNTKGEIYICQAKIQD